MGGRASGGGATADTSLQNLHGSETPASLPPSRIRTLVAKVDFSTWAMVKLGVFGSSGGERGGDGKREKNDCVVFCLFGSLSLTTLKDKPTRDIHDMATLTLDMLRRVRV